MMAKKHQSTSTKKLETTSTKKHHQPTMVERILDDINKK